MARQPLLDYLLRDDGPPLVILQAPAGYGKSTVMAQAAEHCRKKGILVGWATVAAGDAEAELAAAIASAFHDEKAGAGMVAQLERIDELGETFYLFIDDFADAANGAAAALARLIELMPEHLHVIVATRTRLPFNLAALRVKHLVEILDAGALAFSEAELAELRGSRTLSPSLENFLVQSEGWPAMAAIALEGSTGPSGTCARAALPHSVVTDFLEEEIVAHIPEPWREMLYSLSILEEITPDVLRTLLERDDALPFLDWMSARCFLTPAGSELEGGYRINPLLRQHLAAHLIQEEGVSLSLLNAKAACFYLDRGDALKAARHAISSNDIAVIQRLFENTSILRLAFVGGGVLLQMLKEVEPGVARMLPHLVLAEIYLLLMGNQPLRASRMFAVLKQETRNFTAVPDIENAAFMEADALVIEMLIAGYTDRLTVEMIAAAEHRLADMPACDEILLLVLRQLKVWAHYWNGNFLHPDKLRDLLWCRPSGPDPSYVDLYGSFALGVCALERGDLDQAEAHHRHASDLAIRFGGSRGSQAKTARLLLADVAYERNQVERARNLMDGLIEEVERGEGWFDLYASAYLTGSLLAFETSWESALSVLDRGDATAARVELDKLRLAIAAQRLKLAVMAGEMQLAQGQYDLLEKSGALDLLPENGSGFGWRITVPAQLAAVRFHLASDDPQKALNRLARMPVRRDGHRQNRRLIESHLLTGIAYDRLGNWSAAASALAQALQLGSRTGMVRVFVDLDAMLAAPMDTLLRRRSQGTNEELDLARQLRGLFRCSPNRSAAPRMVDEAPNTPTLSERERDVLSILATGKTYKEIAYDLQISINTVMTHRKKLYRKLGTSSRSKALSRARGMGLIP